MRSKHIALCYLLSIFALYSCSTIKKTPRRAANTSSSSAPYVSEPLEMKKADKEIADKFAAIMEVYPSNIQNGKLYSFIDEWLGTPYRYGGLDKDGVDCSGFVYNLQREVYHIENMPRSTGQQVTAIKRKYEEELKEGDLVFFDFDGKQFSHVGIYLQNGYIVHASSRRGVIVVRLHDPSMYKYFSRAGTLITEQQNDAAMGSK